MWSMTRHREITLLVQSLIDKGVIYEKQESLARQAVYEGLKQIQQERNKEREEYSNGSNDIQTNIHRS